MLIAKIINELPARISQFGKNKFVKVVGTDAQGTADGLETGVCSSLEKGGETGVDSVVHKAEILCCKYGHPSDELQENAGGPEQIFTIF